ncbi:hypothetical protein IAT40_001720 [Kwoniella sp. CBS 6097]
MSAEEYQVEPPVLPKSIREELEIEEGNKNVRHNRFLVKENLDYLAHLRQRVKDIEGFWLHALINHSQLAAVTTSKEDEHALSFLQDIELVQDVNDFRPFELKFHFKENPYFSNSVLSKKYTLPKGTESAPADGTITDELRQFEGVEDLEASTVKIEWKSDDKNLTKKHPRVIQGAHEHKEGEDCDHEDDGGYEGDLGSFFLYFETAEDPLQIGEIFISDILPDAFAYFENRGDNSQGDEFGIDSEDDEGDDDELDEESGDEDGSIDLEDEEDDLPSKKKRKLAKGKNGQ